MQFRTDTDRRDFISLGAAAGFSAAFGAPIGGVLFSLEEASSFWSHKLMWRALAASLAATCTLCFLKGAGDIAKLDFQNIGLISFRGSGYADGELSWQLAELPPFAVTGMIGGVLGAMFNRAVVWLAPYRMTSKHGKVAEVAVLSISTSIVCYCVAMYSSWVCVPAASFPFVLDGNSTSAASQWRYNCDEGYVNELASVLYVDRR